MFLLYHEIGEKRKGILCRFVTSDTLYT